MRIVAAEKIGIETVAPDIAGGSRLEILHSDRKSVRGGRFSRKCLSSATVILFDFYVSFKWSEVLLQNLVRLLCNMLL